MSEEYLGKAYVLHHYADAVVCEDETGYVVVAEKDEERLGGGRTPMDAWHDAALEIDREF